MENLLKFNPEVPQRRGTVQELIDLFNKGSKEEEKQKDSAKDLSALASSLLTTKKVKAAATYVRVVRRSWRIIKWAMPEFASRFLEFITIGVTTVAMRNETTLTQAVLLAKGELLVGLFYGLSIVFTFITYYIIRFKIAYITIERNKGRLTKLLCFSVDTRWISFNFKLFRIGGEILCVGFAWAIGSNLGAVLGILLIKAFKKRILGGKG